MSSLCLNCGYPVTEPICASCLINEIRVWLHEQKIKKYKIKKINQKLEFLLRDIESLDYVLFPSSDIWDLSVMQCNECQKEMRVMCFYCVIDRASGIVKSNLENGSSIKNFRECFNTSGYDSGLDGGT